MCFVIFLLLVPAVAFAHPGHEHLEAHEIITWWTWNPWLLAVLFTVAAAYTIGAIRVSRQSKARPWEYIAFVLGWITLIVALISPIDRLSDILFSAHMSQHELIMLVAAPLLVLARPVPYYLFALPPRARAVAASALQSGPGLRVWRFLTGPVVAFALHMIVRWIWHIPFLFEAALRDETVHGFQHFTFFVTACFFWWSLVNGRYGRTGYGIAVLFVFATATHTSVLGALITLAPRVIYPMYIDRGAPWGVSAIDDQQLAGLIMWVAAGAVFIVLGLALFAAWLGAARARAEQATLARDQLARVS